MRLDKPRHSLDPNRPNTEGTGRRSAATVRRLNLYKKRPVRNKKGKIIREDFQSKDLPDTRIAPDRRWFGNTRVIGQKQLEKFREEMSTKVEDSFKVLLREKKLPLALLREPSSKDRHMGKSASLLRVEPFEDVFGKRKKRNRPKLGVSSLEDLIDRVDSGRDAYDNTKDRDLVREDDGLRESGLDSMFSKGQSKRIWGELYKVIDSSDVVIQVHREISRGQIEDVYRFWILGTQKGRGLITWRPI